MDAQQWCRPNNIWRLVPKKHVLPLMVIPADIWMSQFMSKAKQRDVRANEGQPDIHGKVTVQVSAARGD